MRCKDCPVGHKDSNHKRKLAIDIDLFEIYTNALGKKEALYLTDTEDHRKLGEFWEMLHPLCRWGGHWGDGNHYSIEHQGMK